MRRFPSATRRLCRPPAARAWLASALLALLAAAPLRAARAGGLELADRGTRALGQGFAQVAAPDAPDALWYNPAGLAGAGRQLLGGASLLWMRAEFSRIDGGGNRLPPVSLRAPLLPLPTLAYSDPLGSRRWTFGLGLFAPSSVLFAWPEQVTVDGQPRPAPQRYSLYSLEGSALVHLVGGAAYRLGRHLAVGIAPVLVLGAFQSRVAVSACDGVVCAHPESPEYDGVAEIRKSPVIGPSLSAGVSWQPDGGAWRLGASVRLPVRLLGPGKLRMRMPSAALFDGAYLEGERVDMVFGLPLVVRAGAQWRPSERLRLDAALVYEHWASEDSIRIEPSEEIWVRGIRIIQEYQVGPIEIPRRMRPVLSVRLGGQWAPTDGELWLRAGLMVENSSFEDAYLTPMTLDSDKLVAGLGASVRLGASWWLDVAYGHLFLRDRSVRDSRVYQPSALRPPRSDGVPPSEGGAVPIGNGDYAMEADMLSVAVRWRPEGAAPETPATEEEEEEAPPPAEPERDERAGAAETEAAGRPGEPAPRPADDAEPSRPARRPSGGARPWWERGGSRRGSTTAPPANRGQRPTRRQADDEEDQAPERTRPRRPRRRWWERSR